ncbi:MAG: endonuclease Q family protein [bacterium]|nr:endonuclease Q family protein [bacterium]
MIQQIVDLHIHSKYARACSPQLELPNIAKACEEKGIDIVSTGDFTHPLWFRHIEENLEEVENSGLYKLKNSTSKTKFILGTEISCIYKHKEKTRRVHLLILAPSIALAKEFNARLTAKGANLSSDGRPIMGLHAKAVLQIMNEIDPGFFMIPAHAWTPWFAIFGSKSGYDLIEDCFEELSPQIRAIETGLSSDPTMNHRLSKLDGITMVSNSDAHSLDNLGREANVLTFEKEKDITYKNIIDIIKTGDKQRFLYTIEFYPEEGMYHFDGHLDCGVCLTPAESKKLKNICPVCKRPLTVGVLHRVDDLADRTEKQIPVVKFIPHKYIVPLREIIAGVEDVGKKSKRVAKIYRELINKLGSEFSILLDKSLDEITAASGDKNIALAIGNMREGKVKVTPGYDGKYGVVDVLPRGKSGLAQSRLI